MNDEEEPVDAGHVIFSLFINSDEAITALAGFSGRRVHHPGNDHLYVIYETTFDEPDGPLRADRVDSSIHGALDILAATGVDLKGLVDAGVTVRAFFTFPAGPETFSAQAIERLAKTYATVWLDL